MKHTFEFIAKTTEGKTFHMLYKGKSSRNTKVTKKIQEDLKRAYGIQEADIEELYLKPIKK